ncbi:hypothetical protein, partial [Parasedimentitalea maritima]|uniref:hypothetical protein n=1 Tax=Parasedimentitalea maritima TaxID=2578117 RepID=UPI001AD9A511
KRVLKRVLRTRNQLSLLIESQNKQTKRENKDNQVKGKKMDSKGSRSLFMHIDSGRLKKIYGRKATGMNVSRLTVYYRVSLKTI